MRKPLLFLIITSIVGCMKPEESSISTNNNSNNDNSAEQIECDYTYPEIGGLLIDIDSWNGMDPGTVGDFQFDSGYTYDKHIWLLVSLFQYPNNWEI